MHSNSILFGSAYYEEYMPYNRILQDFSMMKKAGMNTVRIGESTWSSLEPEDGIFNFNHIDLMLQTASDVGLSVIVGTPTYAIPSWLAIKYPDILVIGKEGQAKYGHRQTMDILNPNYRFHCERMIRELLQHIHKHPSIIGYQLDNETKSYGNYGPYAQQEFITYLKNKFPDINNLNSSFGLNYWSNRIHDWSQFPDIRGSINGSLNGEFKKFQRSMVSDFLNFQNAIVCEYLQKNQFITQNFDYGWTTHSYGLQPEVDQVDAAKQLTIAGFDIYHPSQNKYTGKEISFGGSIARSIKNTNYFILETQAQGNINWLPFEKQLLSQAFSHFSNGADSLLYWNWHSIHNSLESYWMGVLGHDLRENRAYKEICELGEELKKYGDHIYHLEKNNQVAILLDHNSLIGLAEFPLSNNITYNDIFRWLHDAIYELNIECDVIFSSQINTLTDLCKYQYLLIPAYYSAEESILHLINSYVEQGGHLICTYKTAYADEYLKIRHESQPYIINKCLGLTYQQFTNPDETTLKFYNPQIEKKYFETKVQVSTFMELLIPSTAKVIASYENTGFYDTAAITENNYGLGSALYLGCHFDSTTLKDILYEYFQRNKFEMDRNQFPIIHKMGINQFQKTIHYYFNYSNSRQKVHVNYNNVYDLRGAVHLTSLIEFYLEPWDFKILEL